ncbi:hypothetical protein D3C86_1422790 [compost metagenome]
MVFSSTRALLLSASSFLMRPETSLKALPTVELTAPPMTKPSASLFAMCVPYASSNRSKAAQSVSHHTIRSKVMASISAAENPVSLAKRLAAILSVVALHVVLFDQAKIAGLNAVVVLEFKR